MMRLRLRTRVNAERTDEALEQARQEGYDAGHGAVLAALIENARQAGYDDGFDDGLAAVPSVCSPHEFSEQGDLRRGA